MAEVNESVAVIMNEEANVQYRYKDMDRVFDSLGDIISHHIDYQRPRLSVLNDYYKGNNTGIEKRRGRTNSERSDNRISNPFAKNISQFVQGYITGIPVKVGADDEDMKSLVSQVEEDSGLPTLNSELVLDLSKYGRAYELVFYKESKGDRSVLLDVSNTFIIYDTSVTAEELCGVHYRLTGDNGNIGEEDEEQEVEVTVYTSEEVYVLKTTTMEDFKVEVDTEVSTVHSYGEVPIIEYTVDRTRQGDYEQVVGLIDAYDSVESDIANFFSDFNDTILVFSGDLRNLDWKSIDEGLRDGTILELDGGTDIDGNRLPITASYLTREYDFSGSDSYLDRLKKDIHKYSSIPDMGELQFGYNISGTAMRYKLINLEQLTDMKTRAMEKGFNKRYRMIVESKEFTKEFTGIKNKRLTYTWTANMPETVEDEMKAVYDMGGEFSQETLLSTVSFIDSAEDEKKRILSEKIGVTVDEINKLAPEELRYIMSKMRGQDVVSLDVLLDKDTGQGNGETGVDRLDTLVNGE